MNTDPYEVLGCPSSTPLEEIEATYRLLLRQHHPDLHQSEGPDAVARAEHTTRRLNLAIAHIRHTHGKAADRSGPVPPSDAGRRGGGFGGYRYTGPDPWQTQKRQPSADADWSDGDGHDPHEPVPCPYCGVGFVTLDEFSTHLTVAHHLHDAPVPGAELARPLAILGKLRFVPPGLVLVAIGLVIISGLPVWVFLSGMIFLLVVMWTHTSKRFKPPALRHR